MNTKEFTENIDLLLKPIGFAKKGNFWRKETYEIEKIINLQKSNFSRLYYLNFGYNLLGLQYNKVTMHIFNRLDQIETFDLENGMDSNERIFKISETINKVLLPEMEKINNEKDLVNSLKNRIHLNDIPLKVKDYLKL
jgi:hypothetical protein